MTAPLRLLGFAALGALVSCGEKNGGGGTAGGGGGPGRDAGGLLATIESFEAESFSDEREARRIENEGIVPIWDALLAAAPAERLDTLAAVPFDTLVLGTAGAPERHDLGIVTRTIGPGGESLTPEKFRSYIETYKKAGYTLVHSDWHHGAFERDAGGAAVSEVRFALQGTRRNGLDRLEFKGTLRVTWDESGGKVRPAAIELLQAASRQRRGPQAFTLRTVIEGGNPNPADRDDMGALAVYDLNRDQLPEIILGNANKILWNKGNFQFEPGPIVPEDGLFFDSVTGIVADFNGDNLPDWFSDTAKGDLALWMGEPGGGFARIPRRVKLGEFQLRVPSFFTAGDIDRDGDLDVFIGQWRSLYEKMPDKFWDANDGYGNTLLLNDGSGKFTDATEAAGLAAKRFRRAYSGSFLDLDDDRDLDLLVVSDFHGVDVFRNDGSGQFTDVTGETVDNPYSFGMSHTVADYDRDGRADFYVLGMGSTTARRLERMKANPREHEEANRMRSVMGYGNRMYLAQGGGRYEAPPFYPQVARTGWTWGSASADFDNDGDQDIYAANGHISGQTSRDYCTNFWCRDIYLMQKFEKPAIASYFETLPQVEQQSWDGYQVNPLLVNQSGGGFRDFGFLLDVGFNFDCRRVVAADLDLDGRPDLLVGRIEGTSGFFHDGKSEVEPPGLLVLQNTLPEAAARHWIGVTLQGAAGVSPQGATITLETPAGRRQAVVLSGDSFLSQHPAQKHFGLGAEAAVTRIVVRWPNGAVTELEAPAADRYHPVEPPAP
ncbi:MAG: CRTAC1 family protein [Akkermansiaceae bacterium]|nr:CRTAC1 family protein [Akkermansiaceae bacterium]